MGLRKINIDEWLAIYFTITTFLEIVLVISIVLRSRLKDTQIHWPCTKVEVAHVLLTFCGLISTLYTKHVIRIAITTIIVVMEIVFSAGLITPVHFAESKMTGRKKAIPILSYASFVLMLLECVFMWVLMIQNPRVYTTADVAVEAILLIVLAYLIYRFINSSQSKAATNPASNKVAVNHADNEAADNHISCDAQINYADIHSLANPPRSEDAGTLKNDLMSFPLVLLFPLGWFPVHLCMLMVLVERVDANWSEMCAEVVAYGALFNSLLEVFITVSLNRSGNKINESG